MIWCIIGIGLFILAFVFNKLANICYNKYYDTGKDSYDTACDTLEGLGIGSFIISLLIIIGSLVLLILSHTYVAECEVQKAKDQHDAYITLLEENKDITVQNQLYKDIVAYNANIREKKYYNKSIWTNWFYCDGWDEIEEIEINNYNTQENDYEN
jgi:hypothetical protein